MTPNLIKVRRRYENDAEGTERDFFVFPQHIVAIEVRPYKDGEFTKHELIGHMTNGMAVVIERNHASETDAERGLAKLFDPDSPARQL